MECHILPFYHQDCFFSPSLYRLNGNADKVSFTETRLTHFNPNSFTSSQPLSRLRSVSILEVPLGKEIHTLAWGFNAFAALGARASNSALVRTMICIQSNLPLRVGHRAVSCFTVSS